MTGGPGTGGAAPLGLGDGDRPLPVNLASRVLGAGVVAASDDAFGAKENLVTDADPVHVPGRFSLTGEIVDGWETRRRRDPGHDWAVVRLGAPGTIQRLVVDTSTFTGNYPAAVAVEACAVPGHPAPAELLAGTTHWQPLLGRTPLTGAGVLAADLTGTAAQRRWTHLRLTIDPDGGVARLRALGRPVPDPARFDGVTVDLLARELGGLVIAWSDAYYTHPEVLTLPDLPRTMGDGWEARRRRGGGHDWVVARLAAAARPVLAEVDTTWFVHNASSHVALWGASASDVATGEEPGADHAAWFPLLPLTRLHPDTRHRFALHLPAGREVSWVRLDAHPDGGLARLRLHGRPTDAGLADLRDAWQRTGRTAAEGPPAPHSPR